MLSGLLVALFICCAAQFISIEAAINSGFDKGIARTASSGVDSPVQRHGSMASTLHKLALLRGGGSDTVEEIVDLEHFNSVLADAGDKLVVVDFTATWCGPCKAIAPAYQQLSEQFTESVFLKIDVDKADSVARRYEVMSMPTFIFLKNGKVVDRFSGASVQKLVETINNYL